MSLGYVLTLDPCCSINSSTPTGIDTNHDALVDIFAGPGSIRHLALGILAGFIGNPYDLAMYALFTGYQVSQAQTGESWQSTGGELIEFGIGILVSKLLTVGIGKKGKR